MASCRPRPLLFPSSLYAASFSSIDPAMRVDAVGRSAARVLLFSRIRSSIEPLMISLFTVTGRVCPMRCTRSMACSSAAVKKRCVNRELRCQIQGDKAEYCCLLTTIQSGVEDETEVGYDQVQSGCPSLHRQQ